MSKFWAISDSDNSESSFSEGDNDDVGSVDWSSDDDDESKYETNKSSKQSDFKNDDTMSELSFINPNLDRNKLEKDNSGITTNLSLDPNLAWEQIGNEQLFLDTPRSNVRYSNLTEDEPLHTRFVCISDTHAQHRKIPFLPSGDVLIHGGDFTKCGELGSVQDLNDYFGVHRDKFEHILCIAGNHDTTFHPEYYKTSKRCKSLNFDCTNAKSYLNNCTYLEDSTCFVGPKDQNVAAPTTTNDILAVPSSSCPIEVYGSPWTPEFYDWAFMKPRGQPLLDIWSKIPATTDVLITHGPPLGRNDKTDHSGYAGCLDLLQEVQHRIRPRVHIFGHIHQGYGTSFDGTTLYINASSLLTLHRMNPCIVVDVPHDRSQPARLVEPECPILDADSFLTWLEQNDYNVLVQHIREEASRQEKQEGSWLMSLPMGNSLLEESAFEDLCNLLLLHRTKEAQKELQRALCQLYAESF